MRPTFEILGLRSGSAGDGQETVIAARAPPIQAMAYDFGWVFGTWPLQLRGKGVLPTVDGIQEVLAAQIMFTAVGLLI